MWGTWEYACCRHTFNCSVDGSRTIWCVKSEKKCASYVGQTIYLHIKLQSRRSDRRPVALKYQHFIYIFSALNAMMSGLSFDNIFGWDCATYGWMRHFRIRQRADAKPNDYHFYYILFSDLRGVVQRTRSHNFLLGFFFLLSFFAFSESPKMSNYHRTYVRFGVIIHLHSVYEARKNKRRHNGFCGWDRLTTIIIYYEKFAFWATAAAVTGSDHCRHVDGFLLFFFAGLNNFSNIFFLSHMMIRLCEPTKRLCRARDVIRFFFLRI